MPESSNASGTADDPDYALNLALASINLAVLIALVPIQIWILWRADVLFQNPQFRRSTRFLTARFRATTYWFQLVLTVRNYGLALVPVVAPTSPSLQVALYVVILLFYSIAAALYYP